MKILHLTLKKKWFDMIAAGVKREEYREQKPYWNKRLLHRQFDAIQFRNGYGKDAPFMLIECKKLHSGLGNIDWGAPPGTPVFILPLGNILVPPVSIKAICQRNVLKSVTTSNQVIEDKPCSYFPAESEKP